MILRLVDETGKEIVEVDLPDELADQIDEITGVTKFREEKWKEFLMSAIDSFTKDDDV